MRPEEPRQRSALTLGRVKLIPASGFDCHHACAFKVRDADPKGGGPRYLLAACRPFPLYLRGAPAIAVRSSARVRFGR